MNKLKKIFGSRPHPLAILLILLSLGYAVNREYYATGITLGGYRMTAFVDNLSGNSHVAVPSVFSVNQKIDAINLTGSNPYNVLSIDQYGTNLANATVVGLEDTARGNDNTPALRLAVQAALPGQRIWIGPGKRVFRDTIRLDQSNKKIFIECAAETHHNKKSWIVIGPPASGADVHHHIIHHNIAFGRENIPTHNKITHDAHTGPPWATYTNRFIEIVDNSKNNIEVTKVVGFGAAFTVTGINSGSQENNFSSQYLDRNAVGVDLRSKTGYTFQDKNNFTGPNGGTWRISGGLGIKFDGYAGTEYNGTAYNGSFLTNHFVNPLLELLDSGIVANGDLRENEFRGMAVEAGTSTGILGTVGIDLRINGPNYARGTQFIGCSFMCTQLMNNMGTTTTISHTPIWLNCSTKIGERASTDGAGVLTVFVPSSLPMSTRTALPAGWRTANELEAKIAAVTTSSSYTVAVGVTDVYQNNGAGITTLPAASSRPFSSINIFNENTGTLTVSNVASGYISKIPGRSSVRYESDGIVWRSVGLPAYIIGFLGGYNRASDTNLTVALSDFTAVIYNMTANRTMTLPDPVLNPNRVLNIGQRVGNGFTVNLSESIYPGGGTGGVNTITGNTLYQIQSDGIRWQITMQN